MLFRVLLVVVTITLGQVSSTPRVEFEVASVKPNNTGSGSSTTHNRNGRYDATNVQLRQVVLSAFQLREHQLIGPDWMNSDRYDLRPKAPDGVPDTQLYLMLQSLLTDQFKMKFHRETREMPIYALVVAKDGHKLVESDATVDAGTGRGSAPSNPVGAGTGGSSATGGSGGRLSTMQTDGPLSVFVGSLNRNMDRPVVDMTGLTGRYKITFAYKSENAAADVDGPSIFTAVTEQLGLRFEARRGPIDVVIIDSIEKVRDLQVSLVGGHHE